MTLIGCNEIKIGKSQGNGNEPLIAISTFDENADTFLKSFSKGSRHFDDLYEIRYDLFVKKSPEELGRILSYLKEKEVDYIFTYRSDSEEEICKYYGIAAKLDAPAADVEMSVYEKLPAGAKFKTLIISHHSFEGGKILPYYEKIRALGPDIVKLASAYRNYDEFREDLAELQKAKAKDRNCLSFVPMGRSSAFLRIMSAYILSDLVYAREEEETAEGQLTKEQYRIAFSNF